MAAEWRYIMGRLFGTDGVRGIANKELTCEHALEIGRAAASVLTLKKNHKPVFVIGCDTRASSDMLGSAMTAGLCSVGADVINLGVVPTPAVAYLVDKYNADAGVMISASHNPAEFNGIKIFNGNGFKLADMLEDRIEEIVLDKAIIPTLADGAAVGRVKYADNAIADYIDHICESINGSLEGLRIAVDCANGSASASAKTLFEKLGADATILYNAPDGTNINKNCGSTHLDNLAKFVVENKFDCGIAYDGDADRCLCVDELGNVVDGDAIMAICSLNLLKNGKLANDTVVGTIMTNFGFTKFCEANKIKFIATKVGDRYVLEEMLQGEYSLGGEQSGHVIFRDYATTGDGQLTSVQLLSILKSENKKLSELASVMARYPQVSVNIKMTTEGKLAFYTDDDVNSKIEEAKELLGKTGRIVVRPSGTEPLIRVMVEGENAEQIKAIADDVAKIIENKLGSK